MTSQRSPSAGEDLLARFAATPDVFVQKFDLVRDMALLVEFDAKAVKVAEKTGKGVFELGRHSSVQSRDSPMETPAYTENSRRAQPAQGPTDAGPAASMHAAVPALKPLLPVHAAATGSQD